jgi:hypothetical protein
MIPLAPDRLDRILTLQLAVAWAGEGGETPRLGWWRTNLVDPYGGGDLFQRLLPATWRWAMLRSAREAARRVDAAQRGRDHDPDRIVSLFRLGFALDERLDQRLADLTLAGAPPEEALPALTPFLAGPPADGRPFDRDAFAAFLAGAGSGSGPGSGPGKVETTPAPTGRRLPGALPDDLVTAAERLAAALLPLGDRYPLPHYKVAP